MRTGGDPAGAMLAEQLLQRGGAVTVHLHTGTARAALAAARHDGAQGVWYADRYLPSVNAARALFERESLEHIAHVTHAQGTHAFPSPLDADVVTIRIPTDRLSVQQLIWDAFHALKPGGRCLLAGGNNEGIKPAVRLLDTLFGTSQIEAQHSGHRLVVATRPAGGPASTEGFDSPFLDPARFHELHVRADGRDWTLFTRPGVFSWEHLDEATAILADVFEVHSGESVLDIGCGAGLLGMIAAQRSGTGRVVLLDADAEAVRSARRAVDAAGLHNADVRASDVASAITGERFDVVVSNPPFHLGKAVDLSLPRRFIRDTWQCLEPNGRLYLVANRTLPYERVIAEQFGDVRVLHDGARFKVLGAMRSRHE